MKSFTASLITFVVIGAVAEAHIMVSPPEAKAGIIQNYELRVHNEAKVATTSLDLEIPESITVIDITKPAEGTYRTAKAGERISSVRWGLEVPPSKYVALKFSAKNPAGQREVHWNVRQHLADGSVVEWSDKPGAKEKASTTKIGMSQAATGESDHHVEGDHQVDGTHHADGDHHVDGIHHP